MYAKHEISPKTMILTTWQEGLSVDRNIRNFITLKNNCKLLGLEYNDVLGSWDKAVEPLIQMKYDEDILSHIQSEYNQRTAVILGANGEAFLLHIGSDMLQKIELNVLDENGKSESFNILKKLK